MPLTGSNDTTDVGKNVLEPGCELSSLTLPSTSSAANSPPYAAAILDREPNPPDVEGALPADIRDSHGSHMEQAGTHTYITENPGTSQVRGSDPITSKTKHSSAPAENGSYAASNSQPVCSDMELGRGTCSPKLLWNSSGFQAPLASTAEGKLPLPSEEVNAALSALVTTTAPIIACATLSADPCKSPRASMDHNIPIPSEEPPITNHSLPRSFTESDARGDGVRATVAYSGEGAARDSTPHALAASVYIGETETQSTGINPLGLVPESDGPAQGLIHCATGQPDIAQDATVLATYGNPASQQLEIPCPPCRSPEDVQCVEGHLVDATTTLNAAVDVSTPNLATTGKQQVEQVSAVVRSSIVDCEDMDPPQCKSLRMLLDLLAHVKRMDPEGFFKEPVDEEQAEAPGYYDSIANPMDFSTIQSELMCSHNISWRNFMEVFELVCLNALLYNRKGSRIHKSAQQLLRNGRRFLQGKELEGRRAMTTCTCYAPGTEASKAVSILTKLGPGSAYLKQEEKDLSSLEKNVRADEEIAHDNSAWPLRISHPDAEDVEVESASDAASESSSSFGSAGSDPGEGEHDADQPSCESLPTSREFQRLPIGAEWKRYRRGVEWRCRWLELREQDLQRQLQAYDVLEGKLLAQQASKLAHVDMKASLDALDEGSSEGRKAPPVDTPTSLRIKDLDQPENSASTSRSDAEGTVGARKCVNNASLRGDQNQEPPTVGTSARSSLAFTGQGQTTKVHHRRHRKRSRCQSAYKSRKSASKKQEVPWARSGKPVNQAVTLDSGHLLELSCHPVLSRLYKSRATPSARRKRVAAEGRENMGDAEAKEVARVEEQETAAAEKLTLMQQVALAVVAVDDLSSSDSEVSTMALFEQMQDLQRKVGLLREKLGAHMGERLASRTPLSTIGRAGSGFGQSRQRKISTSSMPSSPCRSSGAGAVSTKKDASNRHQQAAAAYLKRKVTPQEEFDLNNIVGGNMGGAGPRFIERAPHMLINTPKVRDLEAGCSIRVVSRSMEGGSMCSEGDGEKAVSKERMLILK